MFSIILWLQEDMSKDQVDSKFWFAEKWVNIKNSFWITVLKKAFDAFDREKQGYISTDMIGTIFEMLGISISDEEVEEIIEEIDSDGEKYIQITNEIIKF